jgi:hypothetical protein
MKQNAIEELRKYGIKGPQVYLIDIIPLIEMIWADGRAQEGEIDVLDDYLEKHVDYINKLAGYDILTPEGAKKCVSLFLKERPNEDLLKTLRSFIVPVRLSSSDAELCNKLRASLLAACLDIASSSVTEYPYGLNDRFNPQEKKCFFEILESLSLCNLNMAV